MSQVCSKWYRLEEIARNHAGAASTYSGIKEDELQRLRSRGHGNMVDILPASFVHKLRSIMSKVARHNESLVWLAEAKLEAGNAEIWFGEAEGYCWFRTIVWRPGELARQRASLLAALG